MLFDTRDRRAKHGKAKIHRSSTLYVPPLVIGILAVLGVAGLIAGSGEAIIAKINSKWAPISVASKAQHAIDDSSAALARIDRPTLLLHLAEQDLAKWFPAEFIKAWSKLQRENPDLNKITVSDPTLALSNQVVQISANLVASLDKPNIKVTARAIGLATVSLDQNRVVIRPGFQQIVVDKITGNFFWFLNDATDPINAVLHTFQDNINGVLPTYSAALPIHPLTLPNEPLQVRTFSVPDIHLPGGKKSISVTLPALQGSSVLIGGGGVTLLASLTTQSAGAQPPLARAAGVPYDQFEQRFSEVAARSGFSIPNKTASQIDHTFFDRYFQASIQPAAPDDAVTRAIKAGEQSLANLKTPNAAVILSSSYLQAEVVAEVAKRLPIWAKHQPISFGKPTFGLGAQRIEVSQPFKATFPTQGISVDGMATILATGAGAEGGGVFQPQIDGIKFIDFHYTELGDLPGVVVGVNTILASAVQAVNAALTPYPVSIPPFILRPLQIASDPSAGLSIAPNQFTLPPITWGETALLIDESGIFILADWEAAHVGPLPSISSLVPDSNGNFKIFRKNFFQAWGATYPRSLAPPAVAAAYLQSKSVAQYLNGILPPSGLQLAYSSGFADSGSTDISIKLNQLPSVHCGNISCDQPCKWYNPPACAAKAACEALNLTQRTACQVALPPIEEIINGLISIADMIQGSLNTQVHGTYNASTNNLRVVLADDLKAATASGDVSGGANLGVRIDIVPKKLANLACVDIPIDRGFTIDAPSQPESVTGIISTEMQPDPSGGSQLVFKVSLSPINATAHTAPLMPTLISIVAQASISCPLYGIPVVSLLGAVAGVGGLPAAAVGLALNKDTAFGQATRALLLGDLSHSFDLPQFHHVLAPMILNAGDRKFVASMELADTLVAATFNAPP